MSKKEELDKTMDKWKIVVTPSKNILIMKKKEEEVEEIKRI